MEQFIRKYQDQIAGVLSGFDRLIFRGSLRRLNYGYCDRELGVVAVGMEQYLWQNGIRFKDYAEHVKSVSEQLKAACLKAFREQNRSILFLRSASTSKEELARRIAREQGIESGLVCAISALEPSPTFEHRGTHIIRRDRPCHVLYQYRIHPAVGWTHARIQTWFPFNIQIAINGREWLACQMDKAGIGYRKHDNCFTAIEDYTRAQALLDAQQKTDWAGLLNDIAGQLNPIRERVFAEYPTEYYWTVYQSEWATDVVFREAGFLERLMRLLVRHGLLSYASPDVLRFFGRRLTGSGSIPGNFHGVVETDLKQRHEGERIKYRMNGNSIKFYDKAYTAWGSVLRAAETTINTVTDFRAYRAKEGGSEDDLQWRVLRKGVADLHRRAEISHAANRRVMDALASVDDARSVEELTRAVLQQALWKGRTVRALRPWSDDRPLLEAILHGEFLINGLRNRDLQRLLYRDEAASPGERRRRSAAVSRLLRLLRAHGLLQKVSKSHRYHVTTAGRTIAVTVLTIARVTTQDLNQLAQAA